jgi:transcription elongation GreA/GreB family factor
MSVAFTKEESAETAAETQLPDRPISSHPNLVTEAGLRALQLQSKAAIRAYEEAQKIEDVNERRRQSAIPLRDARYFAARLHSAQLIQSLTTIGEVGFGSEVRLSATMAAFRVLGSSARMKRTQRMDRSLMFRR